ncbi:MscS Mechanosensitive ion channel [Stanieria cyanosphaera PCC 7437]|uniref:MscS Mechanosensitive ion channel n=1 Tax=Stanieria cyanosphaera (strain ATCC 29371 / PCC 7437) TaxID=111780 RepID=K9XPK7_STAC7|nr:mechanosensitive ion channel family protein [Stanieria cyanosphaera]AFZ34468.1 MscS Mechanosensitive ion channel [Stanieria cyanosphaera PCC 7437]
MERIIKTVISSLQELLASTIKILPAILIALVIIMLTRYVAQMMRGIAEKLGKRTLKSSSLQLLLVKTAHVTTWIVGVLLACVVAFPGLRLGDIIATLGLGSVAIGFAFQDIFKNFLAGILLLIQEPFHIHDQIIVGNYEGTVEGIDLRTTKIRTYNGERILLPNSEVFTNAVQVRTAFDSRRTDLAVGVDYNTSLPEAKEILHHTLAKVDAVLDHPKPEIDLVGFGESSIDFVVRYWTTPRQVEVRQAQTEVILAIKQAFDEAEINIPYPIRSLYFYNQDKYNDYLPSQPETETNDGKNDSYSVSQI